MWYGFEKPILRLKKYFVASRQRKKAPQVVLVSAD
jgi:hypothetical protein